MSDFNRFITILICWHSAVRHGCLQPPDSQAQPRHAGAETSASGGEDGTDFWREPIIAKSQGTEGQQQQKEASGQWGREGESQIGFSFLDLHGNSRRSFKLFCVH